MRTVTAAEARFDWDDGDAPLDVFLLANASAFAACDLGGSTRLGSDPGVRATAAPGLTQYYASSRNCSAGRKVALTWGTAETLDWDAQVDATPKTAAFSAYAVVDVAWAGDWDVYQLRSVESWTACDFTGAIKLGAA